MSNLPPPPPGAPAPPPPPMGGWTPPAPPAAKKKKKWPWIVGGIVVLFVIIGVAGGGGSDDDKKENIDASAETTTTAGSKTTTTTKDATAVTPAAPTPTSAAPTTAPTTAAPTTAAPPTTAGSAPTQGKSDEIDDVTIESCGKDPDIGWSEAGISVSNNSSDPSDYSIEVKFESPDHKQVYGSGYAIITSLGSGQTQKETASATETYPDGAVCTLASVERYAS